MGPWNVSTECEGPPEGPQHSAVLAEVVATMGGEEGVMSGAVDSGVGRATEAMTPGSATDGSMRTDRRPAGCRDGSIQISAKPLKCSCERKRIQEFCVL